MALHTVMYKSAGFALFLLPLTIGIAELKYTATVACFVATIAAIQEGVYILAENKQE